MPRAMMHCHFSQQSWQFMACFTHGLDLLWPDLNLCPRYLLLSMLGEEESHRKMCVDTRQHATLSKEPCSRICMWPCVLHDRALQIFLLENISARQRPCKRHTWSPFRLKKNQRFALGMEDFKKCLLLCFCNVEIKSAVGNTLKLTIGLSLPSTNPTPSHIHVTSPFMNIPL